MPYLERESIYHQSFPLAWILVRMVLHGAHRNVVRYYRVWQYANILNTRSICSVMLKVSWEIFPTFSTVINCKLEIVVLITATPHWIGPNFLLHFAADKKSKVPEKYFVITNNEIVRVRYLLFFGNRSSASNLLATKNMAISWMSKNKYFLTICCYTLLLASIGIANSGNGMYIRHVISKKTSYLLDVLRKTFYDD